MNQPRNLVYGHGNVQTKHIGQKAAPAKPVKINKHRVSTESMQPGMTKITGIKTALPAQPTIIIEPKVWAQMEFIVDRCSKEVGWFTLQNYDADRNVFTIYDLVLPEQEVTAVETDISGDELGKASFELIERGGDTSHMYGWFHSHVNMGVSPSGQDERQVEEFLEDLVDTPEIPAFIRGIMNKKGDLKLDVYYMHHGVAYTCVPYKIGQVDDWIAGLDQLIKERVREPQYAYAYGNYGGYKNAVPPVYPVRNANTAPTPPQNVQRDAWWEHEDANQPITPSQAKGFRDAVTDDIYEDDYYCAEAFGVTWQLEDPIEGRPDGWYDDEDYLTLGYEHDNPEAKAFVDNIFHFED